eukprot:6212116-Pleurochrysis_carterae.AAC.1
MPVAVCVMYHHDQVRVELNVALETPVHYALNHVRTQLRNGFLTKKRIASVSALLAMAASSMAQYCIAQTLVRRALSGSNIPTWLGFAMHAAAANIHKVRKPSISQIHQHQRISL